MMPVIEIINNLVLALLIWWGLGKMGVGTLALGTLYAFTNSVKQFFQPISDLAREVQHHPVGLGLRGPHLRAAGSGGSAGAA